MYLSKLIRPYTQDLYILLYANYYPAKLIFKNGLGIIKIRKKAKHMNAEPFWTIT